MKNRTENNHSLDFSPEKFKEILAAGNELVLDRFRTLEDAKAYAGLSPQEIFNWFDEPVPEEGMETDKLLQLVKEQVMDTATLNMGTKMYAYVMTGGTQLSIVAEQLASTINQNVGKWHLAPVISEMEKRVVQWGAEFIGYAPEAAGVLVSGGSAANLTGLTVARNVFFEKMEIRKKGLFGMKPFIVYGSEETHGCVDKSVELLGIGSDHYRKLPVKSDCTVDLAALKAQIEDDIKNGFIPFCLIGNAGTVNTGAIDPLDELADIAEKYGLWFHVDGAYGALAAGSPKVRPLYKGIERADSVALDFHKWLYQPFEAGCTLVRNWHNLNRTFYKQATYLSTDVKDDGRFDFNEHHFQLSRNAKALKIWMSFKGYGAGRLREMIQKDIDLTRYLYDQLQESEEFETCSDPKLGIVCFRYLGDQKESGEIDALNKAIIPALEKDGRVFITGTTLHKRPVIRACLINHRLQRSDVDYLVKVMREVGHSLMVEA